MPVTAVTVGCDEKSQRLDRRSGNARSIPRLANRETMIIGLQSLSIGDADLAGMTPAKYVIDVISRTVGIDADLSFGVP
jgi:hypothetical protein